MSKTRRRFTSEFKSEVVKLLMEGGKPLQQVAADLGVYANQLRTWRNEQLAASSVETLARQKAEAAELTRLRRENKRLERENANSATAFFAREVAAS
jgi:transposase